MKGWNSERKIVKAEDLDRELAWFQGFFWASDDNEGKEWRRNFHELRQRDLMLFNLGEIEGKKILDIGCGTAEYLVTLAKMGAQYLGGQDPDEEAIKEGRFKFDKENIKGKLVIGSAVNLDFQDNFFDSVFSSDTFNFLTLEEKEKMISEVFRVLKPGGIFTIKTPNLSFLKISLYLRRILNLLRLKSPFIHIAHTRNNPDSVHIGLTTHADLQKLLENNFFHTPTITYVPLIRKGLPQFITNFMYGKRGFSESIIMTSRKAIFKGVWG